MHMKVRVYVGCGLTHAPPSYKKKIASFKDSLRKIPWIEVLDFVTGNSVVENPDQKHIYLNDIHDCVGTAHAMIGDLSYPSTGLGWELGTSIEKHCIRVMMCANERSLVSNLPIGAALHHSHVTFHQYKGNISALFEYFVQELYALRMRL